jgi:flavorubredoxin
MKFKVVDPGLKVQFVPDHEALQACRELAKKIAKELPA